MSKLPARQEWEPGFAHHKPPVMSMEDELASLRAENNMLKGVLASHADMRALLAELRHIHAHMHNGQVPQARAALGDLLRRFDREST